VREKSADAFYALLAIQIVGAPTTPAPCIAFFSSAFAAKASASLADPNS
jgi:hypothetical protein